MTVIDHGFETVMTAKPEDVRRWQEQLGVEAENVKHWKDAETITFKLTSAEIPELETTVSKTGNAINPDHYQGERMECIDWIEMMLYQEETTGYLKGNILKYLWRYDEKNGIEDLRKARWYLDRLILELEMEDE